MSSRCAWWPWPWRSRGGPLEPVRHPARIGHHSIPAAARRNGHAGHRRHGLAGQHHHLCPPWHRNFPAREFVSNAVSSLQMDPRRVADVEVPELVQLPIHHPSNLPSRLLAPFSDAVRAVDHGNDLLALADNGTVRPASVAGASSAIGPVPQCGWLVDTEPTEISMTRVDMSKFPWTALNYAASDDGKAIVTFDDRAPFVVNLLAGPHTWFVKGDGPYSKLEIRTVTPGVTVCIDGLQQASWGTVTTVSIRAPYLPGLDSLRGFASLAVVITHCAFWVGFYDVGLLGAFAQRLEVGVAIFFVLSGYLLSYPWLAAARTGTPSPAVGTYLRKRALRVLPVYWVTVVLAMTLIETNRDAEQSVWLHNLAMIEYYFEAPFPEGLTQMWSLSTEVAFEPVPPGPLLLLVRAAPSRPLAQCGRRPH